MKTGFFAVGLAAVMASATWQVEAQACVGCTDAGAEAGADVDASQDASTPEGDASVAGDAGSVGHGEDASTSAGDASTPADDASTLSVDDAGDDGGSTSSSSPNGNTGESSGCAVSRTSNASGDAAWGIAMICGGLVLASRKRRR